MCNSATTPHGAAGTACPARGRALAGPAGPGSASLDPATPGDLETNQHAPPDDPYFSDRDRPPDITSAIGAGVFGRDLAERRRVIAALRAEPAGRWQGRVVRLEGCCNVPHVGITDAGAVGAVWFRCRDRLCPLCARARARQVADRVSAAVSKADSMRFLTLTITSTNAPLREQLDRLYDAMRQLRRTPEWKQHVVGGVATVEVTRNAKTGQWHPHAHLLVDGTYWHQPDIVRVWKRITGDSIIVHIKRVPSKRRMAEYMAKYASKPAEIDEWPLHAIEEYAAAIHRRRMLLTFGTLHNVQVDGDNEPERETVRDARVPLAQVETRSRIGCTAARIVLAALARSSLAYQRSLEHRPNGLVPVLATTDELAEASPKHAAEHLRHKWDTERHWFATHLEPPIPPPPEPDPPGPRCRPDDTPPIDDAWVAGRRRHW